MGLALWSRGSNSYAQLGFGDTTSRPNFEVVNNLPFNPSDIVKIESFECTYILTNNGDLYGLGRNLYGELGLGDINPRTSFTFLLSDVKDFFAAIGCIFILKTNETLWYSGAAGDLCGTGTPSGLKTTPVQVPVNLAIKKVITNGYTAFIITNTGDLYSAGQNRHGVACRAGSNLSTFGLCIAGFNVLDVRLIRYLPTFLIFGVISNGALYYCYTAQEYETSVNFLPGRISNLKKVYSYTTILDLTYLHCFGNNNIVTIHLLTKDNVNVTINTLPSTYVIPTYTKEMFYYMYSYTLFNYLTPEKIYSTFHYNETVFNNSGTLEIIDTNLLIQDVEVFFLSPQEFIVAPSVPAPQTASISFSAVANFTANPYAINPETITPPETPVTYDPNAKAVVFNTLNKAVTEYDNFPFNSSCVLQGQTLFANENGLFMLTGTSDNGLQVQSSLKTAALNFGTQQRKRMNGKVYINTAMDGGSIDLNVTVDDATYAYNSGEYQRTEMAVYPVSVGRGLDGEHWTLEVASNECDSLDIESIEFEINPINRRRK